MLISAELVNESVARLKRSRVDPDVLLRKLGEGDRSGRVSGPQRQQRFYALLDQMKDPSAATAVLERIIEGNDLVGVNYLSIGVTRARSVCRIHLRDGNGATIGFGTGSLVCPGVIMTNHHVIANADDARNSLAEFDYEYNAAGVDKPMAAFALLTDPPLIAYKELDFCLVAVSPRSLDQRRSLTEFGWLPLNGARGKAIVGEYLTIIQHPGGERKQVCVRENKLLRYDENGTTLWYKTDTVSGSSGSPVFNQSWQVVALHHSGVPEKDAQGNWLTVDGKIWDSSMDESRVKWIANEGVRISSIVEYLRTRRSSEPLAQSILNSPPEPVETQVGSDGAVLQDWGKTQVVNDELQVTIPLRLAVRIGESAMNTPRVNLAGPQLRQPSPATAPVGADRMKQVEVPSGIELVKVDQSNYDKRQGYDPNFLGGGSLSVPLPQVADPALKAQILKFGAGGKQTSELRYWNYSVLMNKDRRLAFFSAVNVDAQLRPQGAGRDGDQWYIDTRVDEKYQLGSEFYGHQPELEVDRSKNPFDRGHLTRRLDAQWGKTATIAKRNGDDSFHWTNCSPQHYRFNQGAKRWLGLEDYVIDNFAKDSSRRACVINGPVFDAPLSAIDSAGRVVPKIRGKRHKDPTFGNVPIPKLFFKIVACARHDNAIAAAGFLMSQEDLLGTVGRIQGMPALPEERLTEAEARLYQVSIADIATLTGLSFGPLEAVDVGVEEAMESHGPWYIERFGEIRH